MSGKYDDIINLPHPTSQNHPRMSLHDRAAQFSPFAALTGHHAAIAETGRLTDQRIELDESEIARVDAALQHLQELLPERPTVSITYFVPDERKNGGSYQTVTAAETLTSIADPEGILTPPVFERPEEGEAEGRRARRRRDGPPRHETVA